MSKKLQEFFQTKKLVLALGLAGALAFTGGVYVSAQTEISTDPVVAETKQTTEEQETPTVDTPTVTLVEQEVPTTEEPTTDPVETPEVGNGAVTLEQAQVIAAAEHPESTIVKSKTKTHDSVKVFAFYFEDGWKVYVRESDGTVVKVLDRSDKGHDCENKYKKSHQNATAASAHARNADANRGESRNWNHYRSGDGRGHR